MDAAEREGGGWKRAKGHLALGRGRKVGPAKATVREDRTEDMREGKVPEWQGQATVAMSDSVKRDASPQARPGLSARGDQRCHPRVGVPSPKADRAKSWRGACAHS